MITQVEEMAPELGYGMVACALPNKVRHMMRNPTEATKKPAVRVIELARAACETYDAPRKKRTGGGQHGVRQRAKHPQT